MSPFCMLDLSATPRVEEGPGDRPAGVVSDGNAGYYSDPPSATASRFRLAEAMRGSERGGVDRSGFGAVEFAEAIDDRVGNGYYQRLSQNATPKLIDNRIWEDDVRGDLVDPAAGRAGAGESSTLSFRDFGCAVYATAYDSVSEELHQTLLESLILAQDERWRRA